MGRLLGGFIGIGSAGKRLSLEGLVRVILAAVVLAGGVGSLELTGTQSRRPRIATAARVRVHHRHIARCMMFQAAGSNRRVQPTATEANGAQLRGRTLQTGRSAQSGAPAQRADRCLTSFLNRVRAAVHSHDTVVGFGRPPFVPRLPNPSLHWSFKSHADADQWTRSIASHPAR